MKTLKICKNKRGVSPVIATILMVAITVVLAGVLYVMVMHLTNGSNVTTYAVGFGDIGNPQPGNGYVSETIQIASATNGLYLSAVGFKVLQSSGSIAQLYSPITYSLSNGTTYSFDPTTNAWTYSTGPTPYPQPSLVLVNSGASITVEVSTTNQNLATYELVAYGLGSSSVSGSVLLK
ncbi:MAG: archaellin/type IV pilin N-terminal domain-containing protein [Thermoplasmata archaeon]